MSQILQYVSDVSNVSGVSGVSNVSGVSDVSGVSNVSGVSDVSPETFETSETKKNSSLDNRHKGNCSLPLQIAERFLESNNPAGIFDSAEVPVLNQSKL